MLAEVACLLKLHACKVHAPSLPAPFPQRSKQIQLSTKVPRPTNFCTKCTFCLFHALRYQRWALALCPSLGAEGLRSEVLSLLALVA